MNKPKELFCDICLNPMSYVASALKNDQLWHFYYCSGCEVSGHYIDWIYKEHNCPGHQPEFVGTVVRDELYTHRIAQIYRCDRCGAVNEVFRDTRSAGMSGRIELEDPRVLKTLIWNRSVRDLIFPKAEAKEMVAAEEAVLPAEADV